MEDWEKILEQPTQQQRSGVAVAAGAVAIRQQQQQAKERDFMAAAPVAPALKHNAQSALLGNHSHNQTAYWNLCARFCMESA